MSDTSMSVTLVVPVFSTIMDTVVVNGSVPKTGRGMMIELSQSGDPVVEMV